MRQDKNDSRELSKEITRRKKDVRIIKKSLTVKQSGVVVDKNSIQDLYKQFTGKNPKVIIKKPIIKDNKNKPQMAGISKSTSINNTNHKSLTNKSIPEAGISKSIISKDSLTVKHTDKAGEELITNDKVVKLGKKKLINDNTVNSNEAGEKNKSNINNSIIHNRKNNKGSNNIEKIEDSQSGGRNKVINNKDIYTTTEDSNTYKNKDSLPKGSNNIEKLHADRERGNNTFTSSAYLPKGSNNIPLNKADQSIHPKKHSNIGFSPTIIANSIDNKQDSPSNQLNNSNIEAKNNLIIPSQLPVAKENSNISDTTPDNLTVKDDKSIALANNNSIYPKELPRFGCNNCPIGFRCPEYRPGFECMWESKKIKEPSLDSPDSILQEMENIILLEIKTLRRAMLFINMESGIPTLELSEQMEKCFTKLSILHEKKSVSKPKNNNLFLQIFGDMNKQQEKLVSIQ